MPVAAGEEGEPSPAVEGLAGVREAAAPSAPPAVEGLALLPSAGWGGDDAPSAPVSCDDCDVLPSDSGLFGVGLLGSVVVACRLSGVGVLTLDDCAGSSGWPGGLLAGDSVVLVGCGGVVFWGSACSVPVDPPPLLVSVPGSPGGLLGVGSAGELPAGASTPAPPLLPLLAPLLSPVKVDSAGVPSPLASSGGGARSLRGEAAQGGADQANHVCHARPTALHE